MPRVDQTLRARLDIFDNLSTSPRRPLRGCLVACELHSSIAVESHADTKSSLGSNVYRSRGHSYDPIRTHIFHVPLYSRIVVLISTSQGSDLAMLGIALQSSPSQDLCIRKRQVFQRGPSSPCTIPNRNCIHVPKTPSLCKTDSTS